MLITENLQKAIDSLQIRDVYLRNLQAQCIGDFDPKYEANYDALVVQLKHWVKEAAVVALDNDELVLRVKIELGARWSKTEALNSIDEADIKDDSDAVRAFIEVEFIAEYEMTQEVDKECLDEFARKNASYHVWPFWRELLSCQCSRMNLPRVVLPTSQLAHNRHVPGGLEQSIDEGGQP